jgi:hypothetical protein
MYTISVFHVYGIIVLVINVKSIYSFAYQRIFSFAYI